MAWNVDDDDGDDDEDICGMNEGGRWMESTRDSLKVVLKMWNFVKSQELETVNAKYSNVSLAVSHEHRLPCLVHHKSETQPPSHRSQDSDCAGMTLS